MKRLVAILLAISLLVALPCLSLFAQDAAASPAAPDTSQTPDIPQAPAAPAASQAPAIDIVVFLKPYAAAPQESFVALQKAADLVARGKWKSAYESLDDFDKANADPFALAMKTSLMLQGAVRSDMHRAFGLVDLEAGQSLESLRGSQGDYEPIAFDPSALADAQASAGVPPPGILSKVLGDYFYDVLGRFSGQWALSDDEIMAKVLDNYGKAFSLEVYDRSSLLNYAEALVKSSRGDESDAVYRKAIRLGISDPEIRYDYAMALSYRGKKAAALVEIDKAIDYYGDSPDRINAIALGARTAAELGDKEKTEAYYAIADKDYPGNPTPGILRHMISIEMGDEAAAEAAASSLVASYGSNPAVIRSLVSDWYSAGDTDSALSFLSGGIAKGGDDMTLGNLDFYLAVLISQVSQSADDRQTALKALDDAEARFKSALGEDSQVFGVIDQIRQSLQPQAEQPAEPEAGQAAPADQGAPAPDQAAPADQGN